MARQRVDALMQVVAGAGQVVADGKSFHHQARQVDGRDLLDREREVHGVIGFGKRFVDDPGWQIKKIAWAERDLLRDLTG